MVSKIKFFEIKVYGTVQGVYFRKFVKETAEKLNLTGWVKNESDGSVLINAIGDESKLNVLVKMCKKGNLWSNVKSVEHKELKLPNKVPEKFEIIRRA